MKFAIELRDLNNEHDNYKLFYKIKETSLARKWVDHLHINFFNANFPIEKTYCLQGWQKTWDSSYPRNLNHICKKLNESIAYVNSEMPQYGYPVIELDFSVEKIRGPGYRTMMNELHHHFELLRGQVWNPSPWLEYQDHNTRHHVIMLNNFCHEIEKIVDSIKKGTAIHIFGSLMGRDFEGEYFHNKEITELEPEDYQFFEEKDIAWSTINLYYSQLGKNYREVFYDKDEHIERENISGHRYVTGEFVVDFHTYNFRKSIPLEFYRWMEKNNFDVNDKTLGFGVPVVAEIEMQDGQTQRSVFTELLKRNDLYSISLVDDDGTEINRRTFDYTWQDQE